jgi:signal transduction histidine kinase
MAFLTASETALANLIHDLRQPLGNIENSTWCLSSLTTLDDPRVREQIALIERQIEAAESLLNAAAAELSRARVQRAEAAVSLEVTNSPS